MMQPTRTSKPKSSLLLFANMLSAVAAILAAPLIAQEVHGRAVSYLSASFDATIANVGAWAIVALLIGCCYSGLSTALQILAFKLAQPRRNDF